MPATTAITTNRTPPSPANRLIDTGSTIPTATAGTMIPSAPIPIEAATARPAAGNANPSNSGDNRLVPQARTNRPAPPTTNKTASHNPTS